jgi:hypothetical protein
MGSGNVIPLSFFTTPGQRAQRDLHDVPAQHGRQVRRGGGSHASNDDNRRCAGGHQQQPVQTDPEPSAFGLHRPYLLDVNPHPSSFFDFGESVSGQPSGTPSVSVAEWWRMCWSCPSS